MWNEGLAGRAGAKAVKDEVDVLDAPTDKAGGATSAIMKVEAHR